MGESYELTTIADLLKVPIDRLDACLRDLQYALELARLLAGDDMDPALIFGKRITWTDDGDHSVSVKHRDGTPFAILNVTDTQLHGARGSDTGGSHAHD